MTHKKKKKTVRARKHFYTIGQKKRKNKIQNPHHKSRSKWVHIFLNTVRSRRQKSRPLGPPPIPRSRVCPTNENEKRWILRDEGWGVVGSPIRRGVAVTIAFPVRRGSWTCAATNVHRICATCSFNTTSKRYVTLQHTYIYMHILYAQAHNEIMVWLSPESHAYTLQFNPFLPSPNRSSATWSVGAEFRANRLIMYFNARLFDVFLARFLAFYYNSYISFQSDFFICFVCRLISLLFMQPKYLLYYTWVFNFLFIINVRIVLICVCIYK